MVDNKKTDFIREVKVVTQLGGRQMGDDEFKYEEILTRFTESEINAYKQWVSQGFGRVCNKKMTKELNLEWITRHYLSLKMIISASVMITSLEYNIKKGVNISVPYLSYYAILSCCRAIVFTLPSQKWGKNLIEMKHTKILNTVGDCVRKLNIAYGGEILSILSRYRNYRELFSYKFPGSGIDLVSDFGHRFEYDDTVKLCKILCEIAQLNSEQVERYIEKHCLSNIDEWGNCGGKYILKCCIYKNVEQNDTKTDLYMIDEEDECALKYIMEHHSFPVSLYCNLPEWKIRDLFAVWESEEVSYNQDQDIYHLSRKRNVIFQFPCK